MAPPAARAVPRPSPLEWACLVAGVLAVLHYAWLLDDAFVYFRYADNAVFLDYGLVYNAGEYVEGFSSPLWMLLLLGARVLGIDFWLTVQVLGVLAYVAFWALLVAVNRALSPAGAAVVNLPLCTLAVSYPLATTSPRAPSRRSCSWQPRCSHGS